MASVAALSLLLLLIFQSAKANDFNDLLSPLLSPILGWVFPFFDVVFDFVAFAEMGW